MKEKKNIKGSQQKKKNVSKTKKGNTSQKKEQPIAFKSKMVKKPEEKQIIVAKNKMSSNELRNLIIVIVGVLIIFAVFYLITVYITNNKKPEVIANNAIIQYDEILIGTLLSQKNDNYYVMVTKDGDSYVSTYNTYLDKYKEKADALTVYNANLDNAFNKKHYAEKSVTDVSDLSQLKLNSTTLFEIKSGKIVKVYEGKDKILEFLKTLV